MASSGKKKTTMAKLTRESKLREKRAEKQARKNARKHAAETGVDAPDETLTGDQAVETDDEQGLLTYDEAIARA
jgi:hypothetical protein